MADENDHELVVSEQEGSAIMIGANHRETDTRASWKPRFLQNVAAKLTALALWKVVVVVVALALGTGLAAKAVNVLRHHGLGQPASTGIVLGKLVALGDFEAAKRVYSFNFPYVVHKSVLFITGETIQVIGSGSDDALVDFSTLTKGGVVRTARSSLTLLLPSPILGPAVVNLSQTSLREKSGLLTHVSHLFENDPDDEEPVYRAMMSVDVQSSGGKGNMPQLKMREMLSAVLVEAFGRSEIDLDSCHYDDFGDGARVIVPGIVPKYQLIHPVMDELANCLRRANDRLDAGEPIRLRAALHAGDVYLDHERGVAGTSLVVLARLLDSAAVRGLLKATSRMDPVAVIISQHFYEETVPHEYPGIDALAFRVVHVHEREYSADAWLYVPGGTLPPAADSAPGEPDVTASPRRASRRPWTRLRASLSARSERITQRLENSTIGGNSVVIGHREGPPSAPASAAREVTQLIRDVKISGDSTVIGESLTEPEPSEGA